MEKLSVRQGLIRFQSWPWVRAPAGSPGKSDRLGNIPGLIPDDQFRSKRAAKRPTHDERQHAIPLHQWFDLTVESQGTTAGSCEDQMALYAYKDGIDPNGLNGVPALHSFGRP
jgi:hypothetical protein